MNRRGFLASVLAAAAAPSIVRADSLMRIVPRERAVLTLDMIDRAVEAARTARAMVIVGELGRIETFRFIESTDIRGRPTMSAIMNIVPYEGRELVAPPGAVMRLIRGLQ